MRKIIRSTGHQRKREYSWLTQLLFLSFILSQCIPTRAEAQEGNYRNHLMGAQAVGMGGAFTAIANDPSAAYYNPAGYAGIEHLIVGINLNLYKFEHIKINNIIHQPEGSANASGWESNIFPSTSGVAARFGPRDSSGQRVWGGGVSIFASNRAQYNMISTFSGFAGVNQRNIVVNIRRSDKTIMAGPTIARRFGPVSIGIGGLYVHRTFKWNNSENNTLSQCKANALQQCEIQESKGVLAILSGWEGRLNFRVGILAQLNKKWRIGIMGSLSSIVLWGDGYFIFQEHNISRDKDTRPSTEYFERRGLRPKAPLPWNIRIGTAYQANRSFLVTWDVSIHTPLEYKLLDLEKPSQYFQLPRVIRRNLVINLSVGGEFKFTPRLFWRWGAFTNFSSAPRIPEKSMEAYLTRIHMFGVSSSLGIRQWGVAFDVGLALSYGSGQTQRYMTSSESTFERTGIQKFYLQIYMAGSTQMIGKSFQKLWKKVEKSPLIRRIKARQRKRALLRKRREAASRKTAKIPSKQATKPSPRQYGNPTKKKRTPPKSSK